ncbi:ATP-binding protein [Desulfobacter postgatei]|jgi:two-component system sensor histidine kinase HydH|uniref:ATP-binding protein n=1 Tax=Desulfobacter postgatei TaxID=2293 RepID=UPI002A35CF5B|nr:ATP-binding protein [Desulfobacter postgatei]MDX9964523.1 ATP-binding protein [Desulfobacter postgatei]
MNRFKLNITPKMPGLVPPLVMVGVLVVLLPVFILMTLDRVKKQDEFIRERFLITGTSLIRTFEAGTRIGLGSMQWGIERLQSMLEETAGQPDVAYIMITDAMGKIVAHSDAAMVGKIYDGWPDLGSLPMDPHRISSRSLNTQDGPVLELAKRFVPFNPRLRGRGWAAGHGPDPSYGYGYGNMPPGPPGPLGAESSARPAFGAFGQTDHYIFAGMSMAGVQAAQAQGFKNIVIRGLLFFVFCCSGIIALFALQAYWAAQSSLEQVMAFSDNVVQNMPSGLITLDTNFNVTSANRAAEKILGKIPEKAYPQMAAMAAKITGSGGVASGEVALNPKEQGELRLDMTVSAIPADEDQIQGFVLLFRDLTQIRDLKKQVETNRRLAAIGKLAAGVAHEIRNPLSSIKGFATYFSRQYENEPEDVEIAKIMVQEVERMNRSITQLLEFAKPMAVEIKQTRIEPLIRHSLKLVSHDLEKKKIRVETDIRTRRETIHTDPERICQVLLNLYMNALNAMDSGGILEIGVADVQDDIEIRVADNGCGIPAKDLEKVFDPYFTTRAKGTGLGLSIVHRIVENLKGDIRVESRPSKGTVFYIILPANGAVMAESDNESIK